MLIGFKETVAQTGRMRQQLTHADAGGGAIGQKRLEFRQPARDVVVECQLALPDQHHGSSGNDGFAYRSQTKQRVMLHGLSGFPVSKTGRALINRLPMAGHHHHSADQAALAEGRVNDGVDGGIWGRIGSGIAGRFHLRMHADAFW